ncbi:MAG: glycosyltransferase family 2 protein [Oscillospiraceae bacterium]|nr:glycosyltransferase family 2 protein [Oscillospiraceae bacterium]
MNPILSVVVPSYNVEQYLNKALDSYSDVRLNDRVQIIVVNDGSVDRTQEIAESYAARFPHIFEVVNKENGGHGSAVNAGIRNARGKYFRIIDGDDWVNTENFVTLIDYLESADADIIVDNKREVNMVSGDSVYFGKPSSVIADKVYAFTDVCLDENITPNIMIHTMSIKTSLLKYNAVTLLEGIFYVDIEFILKSTVLAKTIEFCDLEVYQYLVGNVNQSVNYKNYVKRFEHHKKVTRELIRFYSSFNDSNPVLNQYLFRRVCLLINTHMNIALIYDDDRKQGLVRAKEFRTYLKSVNIDLYKATQKRYLLTLMLHYLGVDYEKLNKIMRR